MMKNGIELSVNFLVVLILSLVTFGMGIFLVNQISNQGFDAITVTQDQLDAQISKLSCRSQDRVCLVNNNAKLNAGKSVVVGVFILNYLNTDADITVTVDSTRIVFVNKDGQVGSYSDDMTVIPQTYTQSVQPREQGKFGVGVFTKKTAQRGQYTIPITITGDNGYQTLQSKITVTIP